MLVQWPRKGIYSVGFHTGSGPIETPSGDTYINVFLPTTPNPTTGVFILSFRDDEVIHTDLSVEDGFKMLISAGIVAPPAGIVAPDPVGVAEFDPNDWKNGQSG